MVRFCRHCKRALDDTDIFCRECGKCTMDSIDYQTFYTRESVEVVEKPEVVVEKPEVVAEKTEVVVEKKHNFEDRDNITGEFLTLDDIEQSRLALENYIDKCNSPTIKPVEQVVEVEKQPEMAVERLEKQPEMAVERLEKQPEMVVEVEKQSEMAVEKQLDVAVEKQLDVAVEKQLDVAVEKQLDVAVEKQLDVAVEKQLDVAVEKQLDVAVEKQLEVAVEKHEKGYTELLDQLLPKEEDKKGKDKRYLINKTTNQGSIVNNVDSNSGMAKDITILPKEVIKKKRGKRKIKGKFKLYENSIGQFLPELLYDIDNAKDGHIRIKVSDIVEKMGGEFQRKALSSLFCGLKYILYNNGIWIKIGTLNDNSKIFIMRRKNANDRLPQSLIG